MDFEIRELPINFKSSRDMIEKFLAENGLRMDVMDYYVGIFDENDELVAGGGTADNVIKCIAVMKDLREYNLAGMLITRLREHVRSSKQENVFVFTKAENEDIFRNLSFFTVGKTDRTVMMESNPWGIKRYVKYLGSFAGEGVNGAIVMNCNPFTLGHRYLIEQSAKQVDRLHVILVKEGKTMFPYEDRLALVKKGTAHLENVDVIEGSSYVISTATFPNYFIKNLDEISEAQVKLDLDVFIRHIAPALKLKVRFMGSEPLDPLTALYNKKMHELLPAAGIEAVEVSRKEIDGQPVSASRVRKAIVTKDMETVRKLVPPTTLEYIMEHEFQ